MRRVHDPKRPFKTSVIALIVLATSMASVASVAVINSCNSKNTQTDVEIHAHRLRV